MKNLDFLKKLKKESKLELVEISFEVSKSYSVKSDNCLKSAKILFKENLYENSIAESYYSMYNSILSLLFRCGIKCENHTASIIMLKELFGLNNLKKILSEAKRERIDKQYYITDQQNIVTNKETALQMINEAERFILDIRAYIGKLNPLKIEKIRRKLEEL